LKIQTIKEAENGFLDSMYVISHSDKTVSAYKTSINHLRKFLKSNYEMNELELLEQVKSEQLDIFVVIRDFIVYLDKNGSQASAIQSYLSGLKGYLRYMGIRINTDDYKHLVKVPRRRKTREIPITKELLIKLLRNANSKLQTAVIVASASGLRIGELVQLRLSDIDFSENPTILYIRGDTSKGKQSRETFLTAEATRTLQDYLKKNFGWQDNSPNTSLKDIHIFGRTSKEITKPKAEFSVDSSTTALQKSLLHHISGHPELNLKNENGNNAIHFHAFRKYFRTTVGNICGRDYAEALMGHGFYMDTYYQLPEDKKREMYLDAEPHLTISDFKEVEKNLKTLSMKYSELESKFNEFKQYTMTKSIQVPEYMK